MTTPTATGKAKINLDDCLACSGCITSAESVLVSSQGKEEVYKALNRPEFCRLLKEKEHLTDNIDDDKSYDFVLASVSPQTKASFAAKFDLSYSEASKRIEHFLSKILGVGAVFDVSYGRALSLAETAKEFLTRFHQESNLTALPMITSACPGWICYAEKIHPDLIPLISTTKSPQQMMGVLVKNYGSTIVSSNPLRSSTASPDKIFHFTIMPCYDKKLEASRSDFYNDLYRTRDVDCVITSGELEEMMKDFNFSMKEDLKDLDLKGHDLKDFNLNGHDLKDFNMNGQDSKHQESKDHQPLQSTFPALDNFGNSSGGFLLYTLHALAKDIFGSDSSSYEIKKKSVRSSNSPDFQEYILWDCRQEREVVKFASVYGFRNIQNIVRRLRKGMAGAADPRKAPVSEYAFIEIMACPGGCINGGGQLKLVQSEEDLSGPSKGKSRRDILAAGKAFMLKSEQIYGSHSSSPVSLQMQIIQDIRSRFRASCEESNPEIQDSLLRTKYNAIVNSTVSNSLINNW